MEIINLDMTPSTVTPNAHAGQYDLARTVRFMLKNGGVPFTLAGTETITAEITRSDNTEVTVNVENTSSNYVDVVFDDTVCTVKGLYACELRLKDSDGFDIGSKNFALLVQRDPYDGAGIHVETVGPADICTFETTLAEPLQSVLVNVLATGGNGTPENPNPINGYTEANITRCGVNLFDSNKLLSDYSTKYEIGTDGCVKQISTANIADVLWSNSFGQTGAFGIVFRVKYASTGTAGVRPCINYTDGTKLYIYPTNTQDYAEYTVLTNSSKTVKDITTDFGTASNMTSFFLQLAVGENTTYHPYTGNTYTIAFGQTVYGCVLDVTRGKLSVTWTGVDLGSLNWYKVSAIPYPYFSAPIDEAYKYILGNTNSKCSNYTPASIGDSGDAQGYMILNINYVRLRDEDYYNVDENTFKTAMSGVMLIYELATPFDIDLTPEVISAVVGTNNVFADCGQTTVKYLKAE